MTAYTGRRRLVILGAAGRDFHNFHCCYRDDPQIEGVAFTATQIPGIAGRLYPPSRAGSHYPQGIPMYPEAELGTLLATQRIDEVVFTYSDVSKQTVVRMAHMVLAAGADFHLDLEASINAVPCAAVLFGTPVDLRRVLTLRHPTVRVHDEMQEHGSPTLAEVLPHPVQKKRRLV